MLGYLMVGDNIYKKKTIWDLQVEKGQVKNLMEVN
jgi:hypothetical protein